MWFAATAGTPQAEELCRYDRPSKRSQVFLSLAWFPTPAPSMGGRSEKIVACAFPKSDVGHSVAAALCKVGVQ